MSNLITLLPVDELHRHSKARALNDTALASLAESIAEVGLINPIRVRRHANGFEIIAGHHRFAACGLLGWAEIPCVVVDDDDIRAEMSMIAENLHRAELTALERAEQVARWIELSGQRTPAGQQLEPVADDAEFEAFYGALPPAEQQSAPADGISAQVAQKIERGRPEGGLSAASRDLGVDRTDAQRAVKVASLSPEAKAMAREIGVDDNRTALLHAARHATPEAQVQALKDRQGGIAGRIEQKKEHTYEEMRAAILLLREFSAEDMTRICPPAKRAAMCQQLSALIITFEQVKEGVSA